MDIVFTPAISPPMSIDQQDAMSPRRLPKDLILCPVEPNCICATTLEPKTGHLTHVLKDSLIVCIIRSFLCSVVYSFQTR